MKESADALRNPHLIAMAITFELVKINKLLQGVFLQALVL